MRHTDGLAMSRYTLVAEGTAAGLFFPVAIVAGYLLGHWFGGALSLGTLPELVGAALGALAAFLNLWRFLRRMEAGEK